MTSNNNVKKQERGHSLPGGPTGQRTIFKCEGNITQVREGSLTEVTAMEGKKNFEMKHYGRYITLFKTHVHFIVSLRDNVRVGGILQKTVLLKQGVKHEWRIAIRTHMYQLIYIL